MINNENKLTYEDIKLENLKKKDNIPKFLYKYVSLSTLEECQNIENICEKNTRLDNLKFKTLEEETLWLSKFKNLNDPFEYKGLILDLKILEENGWDINSHKKMMDSITNAFYISSFTDTSYNNMPMWAHYSNNHQGFCIKYEILETKNIYSILYKEHKLSINHFYDRLVKTLSYIPKNKIQPNSKEYFEMLNILLLNSRIKHKSWSYENEYRFIRPRYIPDAKNGVSVSLKSLGIKVDHIYIGHDCSEANKLRIIKIAKKNNYAVSNVFSDEESLEYKLKSKLIE